MILRPRPPLRRLLVGGVLAALAIGIIAPFLNANYFQGRVVRALERALQRKVEVGEVHITLLTGPGFSVDKVTIHEDPAVGLEPFAYVTRLEARVNLWKLWAGPLEFSSLRLIGPSVNLAASESKPWNVAPLLKRASGASIPHIQVSEGRINFRSGERKSVYYVSNADLSLAPAAEGFDIQFSGEPARTDRGSRGFGSFRGMLHWRPAQSPERQIALDLELQPSAIAEIMKLLQGRDVGLHGLLASTARIEGSPSRLRITGNMRIEDVHRWDLMAEHGRGWSLPYRGVLDLRAGTFELASPAIVKAGLQLRVRSSDIFNHPRGGAQLILRNMPAAPLLASARHLGFALPAGASATGGTFGVIGYGFAGADAHSTLEGRVRFTEAVLNLPDAVPVRIPRADLLWSRGRLELAPALAEIGNNHATLEGSYDAAQGALALRISTKELDIEEFRKELGRHLGAPRIPMLADAARGSWSGSLAYAASGENAGEWTGKIQVRDTTLNIPGVAEPVSLAAAAVTIDSVKLQVNGMRGAIGEIAFTGDYRYEPSLTRPHRFRLKLPEISAAELEGLFAPALQRPQSFLARALRIGSVPAAPEWLRNRRASGTVDIGAFDVAGARVTDLRARVLWDATAIELTNIEGRWNDSPLLLSGNIELAGQAPRYLLQGTVQNVAWNAGRIDLEGLVRAAGMGSELLNGMRAEGTFAGRSITLQADNFRSVSGCYSLLLDRGAPRLKLTGVQAALGPENYFGDGGTQSDGRIRMELAGARTLLRLTGTTWPFDLESSMVR